MDAIKQKWTIEQDPKTKEYSIDCANGLAKAGTLKFSFGRFRSQVISVDIQQVVYVDSAGNCHLRMRVNEENVMDVNLWVFGLPFFRSTCVQFDFSSEFSALTPRDKGSSLLGEGLYLTAKPVPLPRLPNTA